MTTREAITVAMLRQTISRNISDDDRLVIPIATMNGSVGGAAVVPVVGLHSGFDWDRGKLMIQTVEKLHVVGEPYVEEQKRSRDRGEALAFIWMSARDKRMTPEQRLRAVQLTLKRFGFSHGLEDVE